jgi:hypothetical protein
MGLAATSQTCDLIGFGNSGFLGHGADIDQGKSTFNSVDEAPVLLNILFEEAFGSAGKWTNEARGSLVLRSDPKVASHACCKPFPYNE